MFGTPLEFLGWLAGGGLVLGVLASFLTQVIKKFRPSVTDKLAKYVSILVAVIVSIVAKFALPYIDQVPVEVIAMWPYVVYLFEQIIFDWLHNTGTDGMGFFIWRRAVR